VRILENHYVLAVPDVRESARFYVEKLGFQIVADPPGWIFVSKDSCMIMLGECPDDIHPGELGCHNYFAYLRVDDVDAYHEELRAKGVEPLSGPTGEPWGMRELAIRTSDGHRIKFGQEIKDQK
jgi:catechol 2,3-dioxygenase-like lactoylglutathione lyase family enzyme